MNNFRYTSYAQEIIFGPGSLEQLDQVLQRFPWRRLMLCSSKTLRRNGTITALEKVLGERLVVGYEGIQPHVGRVEDGTNRWNDGDVITEDRKVADAFSLGAHHGKRGGRRGGFKSDSEKHNVLVGIQPGKLQRIGRGIYNPDVHAASLVLKRTALSSGDPHHVAESGEDNIRLLRDGKTIVDSSHGKHTNWAAGPVNQLEFFGENILQTEAINGMRVAAANFHYPVVALGSGQPPNFIRGAGNQFGLSELINISHAELPLRPGT